MIKQDIHKHKSVLLIAMAIYIGWGCLIQSLLSFMVHTGLNTFYSYSFLVLPDDFKSQLMSIFLLILILLNWFGTIPLLQTLGVHVGYIV